MRAKSHDLRKGQWLHHQIYYNLKSQGLEDYDESSILRSILVMENDEFDKIMEEYNK